MNGKDQGWTLGRRAMAGSLVIAHVWGTLLIVAALRGGSSGVIGDMFSAVCFMIFSTLAVLVGGKGWKDFAQLKWNAKLTGGTSDARFSQEPDSALAGAGGCSSPDCPAGLADVADRRAAGRQGEPPGSRL